MDRREIFIGVIALSLMALSLFDYSKETRRQFASGSSVTTINIDGASIVSIGFAIALIFSVRALRRQLGQLAIRARLPCKLPRVRYEWLPLALAPFLLFGYSITTSGAVKDGLVKITSGFGNSPAKLVMLVLLWVLIYVGKLRERLKEIGDRL